MRKRTALVVAGTFMAASLGVAFGQSTPPSTAPAAPSPEKKVQDAPDKMEKKMRSRTVHGRVKSASADSLVVAGKARGKNTEWTFAIDAKTKIRKSGKDVAAADLKEGDGVQIRYMEHDGKLVAQTVMARADRAAKTDAKPGNKAEKKQ